MPDLLVRHVDADIVYRLKASAKQHGRSLQGEVKAILMDAIALSMSEARAAAERWQRRFRGRTMRDSAISLREDRSR